MKRAILCCGLLILLILLTLERAKLTQENYEQYLEVEARVLGCSLLGTEDIFGENSGVYSGRGEITVKAKKICPGLCLGVELEYYLDIGEDWAFSEGNYLSGEGRNCKNGRLELNGSRAEKTERTELEITQPRLIAPEKLEKAELVITSVSGTILKLK